MSTYRVYSEGSNGGSTLAGTTSGTSLSLSGLTVGDGYTYNVVAVDSQGNTSLPSPPVTFTAVGLGHLRHYPERLPGRQRSPIQPLVQRRPADQVADQVGDAAAAVEVRLAELPDPASPGADSWARVRATRRNLACAAVSAAGKASAP